jgi:hypothetical protein
VNSKAKNIAVWAQAIAMIGLTGVLTVQTLIQLLR